MTIEILSKDHCVQCNMSKKTLTKLGVEYTETNMSYDEAALDYAKSLGHLAAPVIIVRDEAGTVVDHFSGFQVEKLKALQTAAVVAA